jgi:hypothetical protein
VKSQWGGMLTEELIIEYDLDEEEAASAWMEAVQMVFKDLAMFIEYNHKQIDEKLKDQHSTCSRILQMFQRELPSPRLFRQEHALQRMQAQRSLLGLSRKVLQRLRKSSAIGLNNRSKG